MGVDGTISASPMLSRRIDRRGFLIGTGAVAAALGVWHFQVQDEPASAPAGSTANNDSASGATARRAKNIIFMQGDGMGVAHRFAGQLHLVGPYQRLNMDSLPVSGLVATTPADPHSVITDSAASATAYATGVKTYNRAIGVDTEGNPVPSILELAKAAGKSTGLVTTSQVTDASPAAYGAHVSTRDDQSEIARQYIEETGVDVILGGGEDWWLPEEDPGVYPDDEDEHGKSSQGNLIKKAQDLGYAYVWDAGSLMAAGGDKLLGLFANEEMYRAAPDGQGAEYDPVVPLEQMLGKALDILSENPEGFFLFAEEEAVDEMAHMNNGKYMLKGVEALDRAVGVALDFIRENPDTLLIVTGDHATGGLAIENLDNPDWPDESGDPDAASPYRSEEDGPFQVANSDDQFMIDWTTGNHTGAMVPLTAMGPGSDQLMGMYENTDVFVAMVNALGLELPDGYQALPAKTETTDGTPESTPLATPVS